MPRKSAADVNIRERVFLISASFERGGESALSFVNLFSSSNADIIGLSRYRKATQPPYRSTIQQIPFHPNAYHRTPVRPFSL